MPQLHAHTVGPLEGITTITASGVTFHVRTRSEGEAICDIRLSPAELRSLLAHVEILAGGELVDVPSIAIAE